MSAQENIPIDAVGRFEVATETGTVYVLDMGGETDTVVRKPGMVRPRAGLKPSLLRGIDFREVALLSRTEIAVGHAATFTLSLDDDLTQHLTGQVTAIDAFDPDVDAPSS